MPRKPSPINLICLLLMAILMSSLLRCCNGKKRDIGEFRKSIRELNDWRLTRAVKKGDVLRINYWESVNK